MQIQVVIPAIIQIINITLPAIKVALIIAEMAFTSHHHIATFAIPPALPAAEQAATAAFHAKLIHF
jgi:hypothetical protein